jgi:asparagine synthase (glutamine-hydrolysing)
MRSPYADNKNRPEIRSGSDAGEDTEPPLSERDQLIKPSWTRALSELDVHSRWEGDGSLRLDIPATAADQVYYRVDGDTLHVTDDLRLLVRPGDTIDERAIYSLLQFGAAIPPLSPWKSISRAVPGRSTTLAGNPLRVGEAEFPTEQMWDHERPPLTEEQQISQVLDTLDQSLLAARKTHRLIILFSGGVDSGLLAARAAALGLTNTLLVNYSFGPDDTESVLAEQMAKHLGLTFHRIHDLGSGMDIGDVLRNAGRDYRTPFCDHSALPTGMLVRQVIDTFGSVGDEFAVIDGTGADGAFGLFGRAGQWQKIHAVPAGFLRIGSLGYRLLRAWQNDSKVEYWLRLLRRASQHRFPLSAVAQNPLAGIAYRVRDEVSREVDALGIKWLSSISPQDPDIQLAALDLSLVCACVFAQKSKSLFASSSLNVSFPFLNQQMVRIALSSEDPKRADREPKWLLKAALARHVPASMVYRPKSGFAAPMHEKLRNDAFLAAFDKLLTGRALLSPFIDAGFLRNIRANLTTGSSLPAQTISAVWGIVFVNEWLEQVVAHAATDPGATAAAGPRRYPSGDGSGLDAWRAADEHDDCVGARPSASFN